MALLWHHRAALAVDFQERYHLVLRDWLVSRSWNETWELVAPLLRDPYSHVVASVQGWIRPPRPVEEAVLTLIDYHRAVNRRKNSPPPQPVSRPWRQRLSDRPPARTVEQKRRARSLIEAHFERVRSMHEDNES